MSTDWSRAQSVLNEYVSTIANQEAAFRVFYWGAREQHFDNPVHRHSFFEVCYVLDGTGAYIDGDTVYSLSTHTLFLSRPGVWHQIKSRSGMLLWYVAFDLDTERCSSAVSSRFQALKTTQTVVLQDCEKAVSPTLWRALIGQTQDEQFLSADVLASTAVALLLTFCPTFVAAEDWVRPQLRRTSRSEQLVRSVETLIRDNLSQRLLLDQVAGYFHISGRQLSRLFKLHLSTTFSEYVLAERLREAVTLIEETDLSISQVADQTGFQSVHYFTNVFRRAKGVPPATYRGCPKRG